MHLQNILVQLEATKKETESALAYFADKVVSFSGVRNYLLEIRNEKSIFTKS